MDSDNGSKNIFMKGQKAVGALRPARGVLNRKEGRRVENGPGKPRRRSSNRASVGDQASHFGGPAGEVSD